MNDGSDESSRPSRPPATVRQTLFNLLGDLVHPSRDRIPTSAFLQAMGDQGHGAPAVRQALLRAGRRGWLASERRGRETSWLLTDRAVRLITDGHQRVAELGEEHSAWDRRWVVVVTTIPHERRVIRGRFYRYLTWSGFGMPVPGLWVSPHAQRESGARFAVDHFGLHDSTACFVGTAGATGMTEESLVARAWNLPDLEEHYRQLTARHLAAVDPEPVARESLRELLRLDDDLRRLPLIDPNLPKELTPDSGLRQDALRLLERRVRLRRRAAQHWASLV